MPTEPIASVEAIPTVSVGLPVFNGENYLAEAVKSILDQTFGDFELIICDNASTDRTEEIARRFAALDKRVRYHRNATNIGGGRNQKLAVDLSRGRYVRLAAHDDLIAPTFLEECVRELENRPDAIICFSGTIVIDEDGNQVSTYQSTRGSANRPSKRLAELAFRVHNCDAIYGVMRTDALRRARPLGNYIDADKVFLSGLAMQGRFHALDRPLFYKRFHPKNYVADWRDRMAWFNPDKKGKPSLPNWLELRDFVRTVATAKIPLRERLLCACVVAAWAVRYSPQLSKDLFVYGRMMLSPSRRNGTPSGIYNWE